MDQYPQTPPSSRPVPGAMPIPVFVPKPLPSAPTLFKNACIFYKDHFPLIFGISAVPAVFSILSLIPGGLAMTIIGGGFSLIAFVATLFAQPALMMAIVGGGGNGAERLPEVVEAYKKIFRIILPFAIIGLIGGLAGFGGATLFLIPGIWIGINIMFSGYVFFAEGKTGMSALVRSWYYVKGAWGAAFIKNLFIGFVFMLISGAFSIIFVIWAAFAGVSGGVEVLQSSASSIGIVSGAVHVVYQDLFLTPVGIIYVYLLYDAFRKRKSLIALQEEETSARRTLWIFFSIGVFVAVALLVLLGYFSADALFSRISMSHNPGFSFTAYPFANIIGIFRL